MASDGRHALITGSSRGIGRGIALALAQDGVKVAIHYYQNEAAAKDTLAQVRKRGSDGIVVQADVTRPEQITAMVKKVKEEFGKVDIFVSNARPEVPEFFSGPLDVTLQQWNAAFNSQATAFLVAVREVLPVMNDGGRIFAITYAGGSRTGGMQPWIGMGSAKAALESLVRYFAVACAQRGITVNAISPGWTVDSVLETLPDQVQQLIRDWHVRGWTPMRRLGTPEDAGNVVALFCSERAGWITGQVIYADGGASLMNPEMPTEIQIS
jgi:enoyl-[acyl-carrier protein] reductase III